MIGGTPRILIIRLSAIGDVVRALPILHGLRHRYPNAQIDWAIEPKSSDVVRHHPALDQLLVFQRPSNPLKSLRAFVSFTRMVRAMDYDIVVDAHGILKSGLLALASRAPDRYGFAPPRSQEGSHFFTNHRVRLAGGILNRVTENLRLCESLGVMADEHDLSIYVPLEVREHVDRFFDESFDGGKQVITVHIPVDRPEKQWPLASYAQLADMLIADGRFEVLLTWGPGQLQTVIDTVEHMRRKPVIAPESPDLKHLAWMLYNSHLYFGGDTGPMHIAAAMETPVIAVFGGTNPAQHLPPGGMHRALYAGDKAQHPPHSLEGAKALLEKISPESAYDACVDALTRRSL